jgi:anti-sigma regulatory factor (Ser/Thr protein kinase)
MRQKFIALVSSLSEIRKFIKNFLIEKKIDYKIIQDIELASGEAVMNIVKHGYNNGNEKEFIEILIKLNSKQIEINFYDNGSPVDPKKIKPRDLEDIKPGGLGSHFIEKKIDEVKWKKSSENWINHLIFIKYL